MAVTHLKYMGHPLCGAGDLADPEPRLKFAHPKEVSCKRCHKSMKRRNREGDW